MLVKVYTSFIIILFIYFMQLPVYIYRILKQIPTNVIATCLFMNDIKIDSLNKVFVDVVAMVLKINLRRRIFII